MKDQEPFLIRTIKVQMEPEDVKKETQPQQIIEVRSNTIQTLVKDQLRDQSRESRRSKSGMRLIPDSEDFHLPEDTKPQIRNEIKINEMHQNNVVLAKEVQSPKISAKTVSYNNSKPDSEQLKMNHFLIDPIAFEHVHKFKKDEVA